MISSKTHFQRLLIPGFGTPTLGRSLYIRFYISDTSGFADGPVGISGVFSLPTYFSSTDYFQVYLFVEFLGGTIRFEFLDKRDFWTTPAVERYQEQFVGAAAESNHRRGPTGRWPSSFWRVRYTWCCGARGKLQRLYGVGDGRSRRDGWIGWRMKEVSQTTCGSWSGPGEGWMDGQHVRFMFLYDTIKARRASKQAR